MMRRYFPNNLSPSDLRTYRGWTRLLFLSCLSAIAIIVSLASQNGPLNDKQFITAKNVNSSIVANRN